MRGPLALLVVAGAIGAAAAPPGMKAPPRELAQPEPRQRVPVTVIAHRGASAQQPEHTYEAYDLALEMGADYIEQDLQMTSDGVLVVLHDATLDRTARGPAADCSGRVIEKTLAQLSRCEVSSWAREPGGRLADRAEGSDRPTAEGGPVLTARSPIPTLAGVFERYGADARYYIETKQPAEAPGMEEALLALLDEHGLLPQTETGASRTGDFPRVLIQSFSRASLLRVRSLNADLPLVQLLSRDDVPADPDALDDLLADIAGYAFGVGPSWRAVTPDLVERAHARGLVVHPYTVNEEPLMIRLVDMGVDGLFTDVPDLLLRVRESTPRDEPESPPHR